MPTNLPARLQNSDWAITPYDPGSSMRGKSRTALIIVAVLALSIGLAMTLIPIGGAVVASGQVGVESRIKKVAHPTGGTIAALYVKNGDHVSKGDILVRLDDTVSGAQSELSTLSVDQLLAQRARLEAERLGAPSINWPATLTARPDAGARHAITDEQKLFNIRRSENEGLRAQLMARVSQYHRQIQGYEAQISALRKQSALIEPERRGVKELWDKDLVTISRLNQLERSSVDLQGNVAALQAQIAETQARITETQQQLIQVGETRRSEAGTQLATLNGVLNQEQIRNVAASDQHERSVVRAPYSGTVDKLQFTAIGDVVKPADTMMEIVPDTDRLIVEAAISPADIDQVVLGQKARIRFSAFSSTATPEIRGKVVLVAPERTNDPETRQSYYAVRIAVDQADLARNPELKLRPGMPAETFIETGNRSMISYMTKPLRDQLARAFRDN
jgi:HlyD family type I secretion membrane fusion protein